VNFTLLPFQEVTSAKATEAIRLSMAEVARLGADGDGQAITLSAPTGAGKTVMAAAVLEALLHGDEVEPGHEDLTVVWLSDLPSVNEQTLSRIQVASDRIRDDQLVQVDTDFDGDELEPNRVYFLNTQKLRESSHLVAESETRAFTIWEVLDRTIRRDPSRFVLIIDEAHRGMDRKRQTRDTKEAASIVQRFILGTPDMAKSPIIMGISATPRQFDELIGGTSRTTRKAEADVAEVRASGLIKEKIIVWRPEHGAGAHSEYTLLQRAAQDLNDYRLRWSRYTTSQQLPPVHPILVVQVEDTSGDSITATDVEQAISTIEEVLGPQHPDSYAHSFGDAPATATFGLRSLRYIKPADIDADPQVSVVFFKMSLSTGWDCPRAEVVMSFRVAEDDDYIAQLVGRMVRNPLARRIGSDAVLDSVALYLPKYDRKAVQDIVARLRAGDPDYLAATDAEEGDGLVTCDRDEVLFEKIKTTASTLPTYVVPRRRRMRPIPRLERLAGALSDYEIRPDAPKEMDDALVGHIWTGLQLRRADSNISEAVDRARKVGLDAITLSYLTGQTETQTIQVASTSQSIERLFEHVGAQVGAGIHEKLWRKIRVEDPAVDGDQARLLTIAALGNDSIISGAEDEARNIFDQWDNEHRDEIEQLSDTPRREFEQLDEHADEPRRRHLALPLTVRSRRSSKTIDWPHHLYTDAEGVFPDNLNTWEQDVVERMFGAAGFICWIRNRASQGWAVSAPYDDGAGGWLPVYPDFVFFREVNGKVVADIIDPHGTHLDDAPAKARGLAQFAERHRSSFGRLELLIYDKETDRRKTLDLQKASVRTRVAGVTTNQHLEDLFDLA
jgi:type III restriction enzyme